MWKLIIDNSTSINLGVYNNDLISLKGNESLPVKLNITSWWVINGKFPARVNPDKYGIDLHFIRRPVCTEEQETEKHIFLDCKVANDLWQDV